MNLIFFNTRTRPSTINTLVSNCLDKDIDYNFFLNIYTKLAISKLNYLDKSSPNYERNKILFEK
jgi:hypothetical protein